MFPMPRFAPCLYGEKFLGDKLGDFWGTKEKSDVPDYKTRYIPKDRSTTKLNVHRICTLDFLNAEYALIHAMRMICP